MEEIVNNEPVKEPVPVAQDSEETVAPALDNASAEPDSDPADTVEDNVTKDSIIERLKQIAATDGEISRQEVDSLKSRFYRIQRTESETAHKKYLDEGGDPEAYEPELDPQEQVFKDLLAIVREKRAAQHEAEERLKEENYLKKMQVIEKIKAILENPDEVNKSYNEFRQLQNDWNAAKEVPAEKATELWKTYQVYVEKFYDTLKLNNELRAYDFKKNLDMKTALCEAAEKLADEKDVVSAFRQLQTLHQQFREIGPVSRELREQVWDRFKAASTVINKRHQDYFEARKEQENQNLDQKTAICEIIEGLDTESFKSIADWNSASEQILTLQAKWKTIGFAPQKMNQKIYDRFRAACDAFFVKKSEFFKGLRENMSENLKKKQELVEKAEAIKDSQDWKKTGDELIALQKEWNAVGAVPRKYSDALWTRFRAACDTFFNARKANSSSQNSEQTENLKKKNAIVARLEAIVPEETEGLRQILKDAQAEWNEIGHVPFKEKDKVFKALRVQMDRLYNYLGESASRRRVENFKNSLGEGGNDKVRDRLVRQAEILQQEIKTYENNLGFLNLSKSNKGSNLVDELNRKVDKLRSDLLEIKDKIKILDSKGQ